MRRSVREALVGFSLLAAVATGTGVWMWLRGLSFSRDTWTMRVSFADAAGLAERSPVLYRGVIVGSVRKVEVKDQAVEAELLITDPNLRLARPVVGRVASGSMLGGDPQVTLFSAGKPLPASMPGPSQPGCDDSRQVCNGGRLKGVAAPTFDSVTASVQRLLDQADRERMVEKLVAATDSFERTSRETEKLIRDGQVFVGETQGLVVKLKQSADRLDPILGNINTASVDAAKASKHVRNVTAALDNPRTAADLQATLANAKALTARWEEVGGDVRRLTNDPKFLDGIRSVSAGLGRFFEELYPAQVDAARSREQRKEHQAPARPAVQPAKQPALPAAQP
jgi:phospholipid/cholesterol/gamma-HCH transport system substrate-binding protein